MSYDIQSLPQTVQWAILNSFPLDDLIRYCETNRLVGEICSDSSYFQQRLASKRGDVSLFQQSPFFDPIMRYVHSLAMTGRINDDPGALIYLSDSSMIFPGIERYIGLAKSGVRAIKDDSSSFLLYVLKKTPSLSEQSQIIGALLWKYYEIEASEMRRLFEPFNLLPEDILFQLFDLYRGRHRFESIPFDPTSIGVYLDYIDGLQGNKSDVSYPYLYGLIDGDHMNLLYDKLRSMRSPSDRSQHQLDVLKYIIMNKSNLVPVDLLYLGQPSINDIYELAVNYNNLSIVWYLLSQHPSLRSIVVNPGSIDMVNLLKRYNISLSESDVLAGAMRSGDYRLWNKITENGVPKLDPRQPQGFYKKIFTNIPPYMLETYIRGTKPDRYEIDHIITVFIDNKDFYRLEVILRLDLGHNNYIGKVESLMSQIGTTSALNALEIAKKIIKSTSIPTKTDVQNMFGNPMIGIFGFDSPSYPEISGILNS